MAVEITDERIAAAAARLHEGSWWFTPRQLYYAVCADVETKPVKIASSEVGLGLVLILVAIIVSNRTVLVILGGAGALMVALGAVTHLQERRPPSPGRLLATSFTEFSERLVRDGQAYPGMLDVAVRTAADQPPSGAAVLVVTDRAETAAILAANREQLGPARVECGLDPTDARGVHVVAVHDCDPAGCALVADLRDAGADVVDAGINPRDLVGRRVQMLEGAPARLPRELAGHLSESETDWLRGGRRLELATETPAEIVMRVRAALGGV